jgi:hypothetical protein
MYHPGSTSLGALRPIQVGSRPYDSLWGMAEVLLPAGRWIPPIWPRMASHNLAIRDSNAPRSVPGLGPAADPVISAAITLWCQAPRCTRAPTVGTTWPHPAVWGVHRGGVNRT